jgi:GntR family transcriptional repressor for pyruvate dehydrogenase complex
MAAESATAAHLTVLSEEVTGMFASLDDRPQFLLHEARFHHALAAAAGNPVLLALVEMIAPLAPDRRDAVGDRARSLKDAAQLHLRIYQAVRGRDANAAAALVKECLPTR